MPLIDESTIPAEAKSLVSEIGSTPDKSIPLLQEMQRRYGYIPEKLVEAVAKEIGMPLAELYGVATFYSQFRFTPVGKYLIRVCKGTACHVAGTEMLYSVISDELNVDEGETTEDMLFTLTSVACLGCCSLAPVVMINDTVYGKLTTAKIKKILNGYRNEKG